MCGIHHLLCRCWRHYWDGCAATLCREMVEHLLPIEVVMPSLVQPMLRLLRAHRRALERTENLAQQLAQALPTSSVATPAITPTAAAATAPPSITSPWQSGNMVECDFPGDKTCTVIIQSIVISTTNSAEVWLDDPVDPFAGESFTVLLSALRPVGWVVDPEYEALMASKLIESNRNRFVEEPSGQCGAASVGRQASDNRSASDAEHVRFARELAANTIENQFDLMTDVCGTADDLTQRVFPAKRRVPRKIT